MRFLHIIGTVDPRSGGPIEGVLRSSEILRQKGHSRSVVSLDSPLDPWIPSCPIPVFPLGALPVAVRMRRRWLPWIRYGYTPHLVPWLRAHAREFDVVIVNGLWNFSALAARIALPNSRVPYFVFTHGMLDPWFRRAYPIKTLLKQFFWWFSEGPLLAHARGVLFTTEEERVLAVNAFWPFKLKSFVVGYGTTDVPAGDGRQRTAFRKRIPELGERKYLLYLSRIHPKKGCELLIDAFADSACRFPNLDLVIAGPDEGGLASKLMKRSAILGIANRIHWPGMLVGDEKWGAFRDCEAFVLPSHQENFGIVVAEAMACAKPVLITNKVNIWREVEEGRAGIVSSDDIDGIKRVVEIFLSLSDSEREEMGNNARKVFLDKFFIDNNINILLDIVGANI